MSVILSRPQCFKLLLHICLHLKSNFSVRDLNCMMVWQHTSLVTGGSIKAYNAELWCFLCWVSATCWKSSRVDHDLRHHDAHVTSLQRDQFISHSHVCIAARNCRHHRYFIYISTWRNSNSWNWIESSDKDPSETRKIRNLGCEMPMSHYARPSLRGN